MLQAFSVQVLEKSIRAVPCYFEQVTDSPISIHVRVVTCHARPTKGMGSSVARSRQYCSVQCFQKSELSGSCALTNHFNMPARITQHLQTHLWHRHILLACKTCVRSINKGTPKDSKLGYFCSTNTDSIPVVCPYLPPARHSQTIAQLSKEVLDPDDEFMALGSG